MKKIIILTIFLIINGCNKPKSVFICGDHICVNKVEARQYFEDNLTLEVKIVDYKKSKEINLVELNLNSNSEKKKEISIIEKKQTQNVLKELSIAQIKQKKSELKNRKKLKNKKDTKQAKLKTKKINQIKNQSVIKEKEEKISSVDIKNESKRKKKVPKKPLNKISDICVIIEDCNIDEISKFLVKQGKKKEFPDITIRENK